MPSTVRSLFVAAGVSATGVVGWAKRIPPSRQGEPATGLYIVALTDDPNSMEAALHDCPLSRAAIQELLEVRSELTLDGARPNADALSARSASSWCQTRSSSTSAKAGQRRNVEISELSDRVEEYYSTPLGARSPHAGGWPIKTLVNLNELFVHHTYCADVVRRELLMLDAFADDISDGCRSMLYDPDHVMPFANLTGSKGRKRQGIEGARAPRSRSPRATGSVHRDRAATPKPRGRGSESGSNLTQRVTAGDIRRGIIRIPRATKGLFPSEPIHVDVRLRGEAKNCRWDPRYDHDQERSGVLGIGVVLMRHLVLEGEQLTVRIGGESVHLD